MAPAYGFIVLALFVTSASKTVIWRTGVMNRGADSTPSQEWRLATTIFQIK